MGTAIYRIWEKTARERGNAIALELTGEGRSVTFAELWQRAEAHLPHTSLPSLKNRVVAIQMTNSADWLVAFLTCQRLGAIAMPIDADVPPAGVRKLAGEVRAALLWREGKVEVLAAPSRRLPACLIKLTSGSTGQPRPLLFGDREMLADGHNIIRTMGIRPTDINLAAIPFGHSYGLGNLVMPLIIQGTAIAVCNDPFPHSLGSVIRDSQATVFPAVPALLRGLVRAELPASQLASVRLFISAGSPLEPADASAFLEKYGRRIRNFYGSSETGGISYDRTGEDTLTGQSVGTPLENVSIVRRPSGRLEVSSEAVLRRGNRRRSRGKAAYLLPDIGHLRPDGSVVLAGRRSRMAKIAGKRLNLVEVEKAILGNTQIEGAYVTTFTDSRNRTRLYAAIVGEEDPERLRRGLKERLPSWKIPARWTTLDSFPMTARGKVDYRRLEDLIRQR